MQLLIDSSKGFLQPCLGGTVNTQKADSCGILNLQKMSGGRFRQKDASWHSAISRSGRAFVLWVLLVLRDCLLREVSHWLRASGFSPLLAEPINTLDFYQFRTCAGFGPQMTNPTGCLTPSSTGSMLVHTSRLFSLRLREFAGRVKRPTRIEDCRPPRWGPPKHPKHPNTPPTQKPHTHTHTPCAGAN